MVNEAGAIDPHDIRADGFAAEPALFQRVNIASRLPGANARSEAFRAVVATPLISDADILRVGHPALTRRAAAAAGAIGCMNLDPVRILPVPDIFGGGMPAMLDEGLRNFQGFGSRDRLGRAGLGKGANDNRDDYRS